jgi:epoxyqueuosine reductase
MQKKHEDKVDSGRILRFDHKDTILSRGYWDPDIVPLMQEFGSKWIGIVPPKGSNGYSPIDFALRVGGWAVNEYGAPLSEFGVVGSGLYAWEKQELPWVTYARANPTPADDEKRMSKVVKTAARLMGASLVGIAAIDLQWVYSGWFHRETKEHQPNPLEVSGEYRYAVVMALESNYELFSYSPDYRMAAAVGLGYSKMLEASTKVAAFIKSLGYRAVACGNDTAMIVPFAIDAGLGEQGRAGWIITKEFGPRVRLCKVFTDLPLEPDKPRAFGVARFCAVCSRCAEACPAQAISFGDPTDQGPTDCNFHGIHKWYMNPVKCFSYWAKMGTDCGICVRVCPWNKPNTLPHKIIRNLLANSPFRKLALWGDRIFGYGTKRSDDLFE